MNKKCAIYGKSCTDFCFKIYLQRLKSTLCYYAIARIYIFDCTIFSISSTLDTVVLREYNFFLYISCAYHLHHNYHITQNHNFLFDLININSNCLKEPVKFYFVHTVIVFKPTCSVLILHL